MWTLDGGGIDGEFIITESLATGAVFCSEFIEPPGLTLALSQTQKIPQPRSPDGMAGREAEVHSLSDMSNNKGKTRRRKFVGLVQSLFNSLTRFI